MLLVDLVRINFYSGITKKPFNKHNKVEKEKHLVRNLIVFLHETLPNYNSEPILISCRYLLPVLNRIKMNLISRKII